MTGVDADASKRSRGGEPDSDGLVRTAAILVVAALVVTGLTVGARLLVPLDRMSFPM